MMPTAPETKAIEGEGSSETEYTDVEVLSESIDASVMFHLVIDILGFVLFMHQQIPSILQDISIEFDSLNTEYKDLDVVLSQTAMKPSERRVQMGRKREVKHGIRRFEKLMKTIANTQTALQLVCSEIPHVQSVILILGASPVRPRNVYELCFLHGKDVLSDACDFAKTKVAEGISRKAIRTLISKGAGSDSYAGPSKLFLLVKARSSFNMPLHFLPKRDFRYNKKVSVSTCYQRFGLQDDARRIVYGKLTEVLKPSRFKKSDTTDQKLVIWFQHSRKQRKLDELFEIED